jgi:hypothetical protein
MIVTHWHTVFLTAIVNLRPPRSRRLHGIGGLYKYSIVIGAIVPSEPARDALIVFSTPAFAARLERKDGSAGLPGFSQRKRVTIHVRVRSLWVELDVLFPALSKSIVFWGFTVHER